MKVFSAIFATSSSTPISRSAAATFSTASSVVMSRMSRGTMSFFTSMPSAAKASRNILFCMLGAQAAMTSGRLAWRKSARNRSPSSSHSCGWIIPNSTGSSMRTRLMKSQMSIFSKPGHLPVHTHMIRPGRVSLIGHRPPHYCLAARLWRRAAFPRAPSRYGVFSHLTGRLLVVAYNRLYDYNRTLYPVSMHLYFREPGLMSRAVGA